MQENFQYPPLKDTLGTDQLQWMILKGYMGRKKAGFKHLHFISIFLLYFFILCVTLEEYLTTLCLSLPVYEMGRS